MEKLIEADLFWTKDQLKKVQIELFEYRREQERFTTLVKRKELEYNRLELRRDILKQKLEQIKEEQNNEEEK
jgi:hypothetical protein